MFGKRSTSPLFKVYYLISSKSDVTKVVPFEVVLSGNWSKKYFSFLKVNYLSSSKADVSTFANFSSQNKTNYKNDQTAY